ncbi:MULTISPECIES: TQO small subunit DoxD [Crateriforma]|uniref:DoxX n=1 Tax=Crateriforma conspicua TaxID=2527996 RepID=A0A5C6FNQ2_9PLAN|nr:MULTISPECIES: TQO small subunit DoxD [Crateriforma]TWU64777.1 DoxX [Crateriforma conspicua]
MLKVLYAPLRLATGWGISPRILGWIGVLMLVLLRLTIGWHFYSEGVEKVRSGSWTAEPFFTNARGPLAPMYRDMVWDSEGVYRLDRDRVMLEWARFREQIIRHYGLDDAQQALAQANYAKAVEQYDYVIELNQTDIEEFELGRDRIAALDRDPTRGGVDSLGGQRETIRRERQKLIAPVLSQIDAIAENYELAQNRIANEEQQDRHPALAMAPPPTSLMDTSRIDLILPYFDVVIGLMLMLGLLTPLAALAAAGFLGSVFLSQFPPSTGPSSTMYQLIESMACLVLAATGSGRFAGLDYFFHLITRKTAGPK